MSRRAYLLATAFLAVTACTAKAPETAKAPDTAADEAKIRAEAPIWFDLYNKGDAAGVANLYADDGVVLAPGAPAASGAEAIRTYFASDIAASKAAGVTLSIGDITGVSVSGDMAWLSGTFTVTAGDAIVDTGKYVSVYKRVGADWKLIRDTWNSDKPPAPAAPTT